ncbi:MAG: hypothetical protein IJ608_04625 [Lachnospiraceae bacterium]|nr:hypothetical protein [Lachnospiraceae bacterium]
MYDTPKYVYYKNKRIPGWWKDYLPDEGNPYNDKDTLTLTQGCLSDYWHIHSSNKHYNPRGAEACNAVQKMVYEYFGGAFLSDSFRVGFGGHRGQVIYHEPTHLNYKNAYLETRKGIIYIHIKNARLYYDNVCTFVQNVLQMISSNHMQSGNDWDALAFFPSHTDAQIEKMKKEFQLRNERKGT